MRGFRATLVSSFLQVQFRHGVMIDQWIGKKMMTPYLIVLTKLTNRPKKRSLHMAVPPPPENYFLCFANAYLFIYLFIYSHTVLFFFIYFPMSHC